jgi:predicted ATPase/DNA-binding SARP family transcriptional activator
MVAEASQKASKTQLQQISGTATFSEAQKPASGKVYAHADARPLGPQALLLAVFCGTIVFRRLARGIVGMSGLALFLLGSPRVERDAEPIALQRRRAVALLAYLAVTGRSHSRDTLAALFWPEHDQSSARAGLRRVLSSLRKALGEGWLQVDRETVGLNRDADIWLDASELRNRLMESRTHRHPQEEACPACLSSLAEAAALYRDDFLAGFTLRDSPGFDDWQSFETEGLRNELARVLQQLATGHGAKGEFEPAIAHARRWVVLDPLHEPAHRSLMHLYASSGQRAAALRQYAECKRVLQEEVGALPEKATTLLCQAIREGRELPPLREPTPGVAPAPAAVRHNLPLQLTPFVGREAILAEIAHRLQNPACRLLTLVGPGGSGKTRLALEAAAARLDDFPHGVYFVSLAPLESIEAIVPTVAKALGLSFYAQAPAPPQSQPRQQLLDYLRLKTMLLIMDNFEHLLEGLDLVLQILQAAPKVKMVVTSRARLNLQGEHLFPVPGMALPEWEAPDDAGATLDDAAQYSAVELFLQSARRAQPGFALANDNVADVIRICRLVEGMPLGILLAAAWVAVLSPAEVASEIGHSLDFLEAELRDLPQRQRSMRAVFDRSWRLLTEREREVFQRLSVFRGGFTQRAATQVAGAQLRELRSLVGKSLLQRDPQGRYSVHELLRQYAAQRLAKVPQEWGSAKDRHSAYFAAFLQHRKASFVEVNLSGRALAEFTAETDNVRVGWDWAVVQGRIEDIDRALGGLAVLCRILGWFQEKEAILGRAAQMLEEESVGYAQEALQSGATAALVQGDAGAQVAMADRRRRLVLGKVLAQQGRVCFALGLREKGRALLQRGLEILRDLGAREPMVFALCSLGENTLLQGEGKTLCLEGLAISKEIGYRYGMEMSLHCLGRDAVFRGEYGAAQQLYQEKLAVSKELDQEVVANSLSDLGYVAWCLGQYREAEQLHQQSLVLSEDILLQYGIARSLCRLGLDALGLAEYGEARQLLQESSAIYQELSIPWFSTDVLLCQGEVANALGQCAEAARLAQEALSVSQELAYPDLIARSFQVLGDATYGLGDLQKGRQCFLQALETSMALRAAPLALLTLVGIARLLLAEGEPETASELLALVLHHPASWQWAKDRAAPLIAELKAQLSPDALAAAQERGRARGLEATVADLVGELGQ